MRDCKLIVIVRDDKVNFEGQDISVEELAQIAGFLQVFVGMEWMDGKGSQSLQKSSSERSSLWIMLSRSLM